MSALDIIQKGGEFVVTSETVANGAGLQHASVIRLIDDNMSDFEEFGRVGFEIAPFPTAGGMQSRRVALLNEQQATLLMTFQRNTDQVRAFKKALVKAFFEIGKQVAPTGANLLALAVIEAQQMLEASARQVAELTPRAEAWDELASATGDYEVADAAKMLARAGVETGRQRLFGQLRDLGWIYRAPSGKWKARQSAVDAGYLTEKPQSHHHPRTGELVLDPPQVRVTVRGLERLRVRLGRVVALEVAS
ncbi:phage antirepressor KilAC domain-containing protein [Microbacterium maritypicum]|uniref:phage antirepressor KilAC domain-containing protein n=1 Tax=Microbacterium maritypicum TaxID=33918 RepID=UPI003A93A013